MRVRDTHVCRSLVQCAYCSMSAKIQYNIIHVNVREWNTHTYIYTQISIMLCRSGSVVGKNIHTVCVLLAGREPAISRRK